MQFPFDPHQFSSHVEKVLPRHGKRDGEDEHPPSIFRRLRNVFRRRLLGVQRWKAYQAKSRLSDILTRLPGARESGRKPVLVYVVPYDIVRLRTGGGKRIEGIAKALSADFRVYILSLSPSSRPLSVREVSPDVWMVAIPRSLDFEEKTHDLSGACRGAAPLFAFAGQFGQLPEFNAILEQLSKSVRAWVLASPFAWPVIEHFFQPDSQRLIYDVHDNLPGFLQIGLSCYSPERLAQAEQMEGAMLKEVSIAACCTVEDLSAILARQPLVAGKGIVVPNGVDVAACQWAPPERAGKTRRHVGLDRPIAVFAGANYNPNHEAVDRIVRELAPALPQILFVVMGMHLSPYRAFGGAEPCENVVFTGPVSEEIKEAVFSLADVALAPMKSGTGSSLKIPDYIAHGKIVLGTPIGLRGFESFAKFNSIISSENIHEAFGQVLKILEENAATFTESAREARKQVGETLDWSVAVRPLLNAFKGASGPDMP